MKYLLLLSFFVACSAPQMTPKAPAGAIEDTFNLQDKKMEQLVAGDIPPKQVTPVAGIDQKSKDLVKKKTKVKADSVRSKQKKTTAVDAATAEKKNELPDDYPSEYLAMDKKSEVLWKQVNPPIRRGEKSVFRISYFGLTVGDAIIENLGVAQIADRSAHHYQLRLQSAAFYRSIYSIDDFLDSYIDTETLTPLKYSLRQRETKQDVDDLQLFSLKDRKTYYWYRRLKKSDGSEKRKETQAYIPRFFLDHFSGFIYMRGLSLAEHRLVEFPVVSRAEVSLMQLRFLKQEEIEIMGKKFNAWKVSVEAKLNDGLKKKGDLFFWYDSAAEHKLLKFEGKIKIGTVKGEMISYEPGTATN